MPDPFDVEAARRALDEVPAPDLWDEAARRAAEGSVVPLTADGDGRRRGPWLAAAAVAAVAVLAVGTAAVLLDDDDQSVDTTPVTEPVPDPGTTLGGGDVCTVGISGDPILMEAGPADPPLFDTSGQPEGQLVAHTMLGSQVAELHVPGLTLTDLVGERVEDVELARGTASLWFGPDFVQVRWFTGGQEPCESFTVTVAGGTEDGNRHAAVDFAERVLLPSDLGDLAGASLERTAWALDHSTVGGVEIEGNGAAFSILDGEATWSDGCNTFSAPYTQPSPTQLALGDVSSTELPCPTNPTSQAIAAVMSSGTIEVAFGSGVDALFLTAGDTTLTLVPAQPGASTTTTTVASDGDADEAASLVGSSWVVEGIRAGDGDDIPIAYVKGANTPDFEFGPDTISFDDTCNGQLASDVAYEGSSITIGHFGGTERGCGDPITEQAAHIQRVMAGPVEVAFVGDRLELSGSGSTLILRPA